MRLAMAADQYAGTWRSGALDHLLAIVRTSVPGSPYVWWSGSDSVLSRFDQPRRPVHGDGWGLRPTDRRSGFAGAVRGPESGASVKQSLLRIPGAPKGTVRHSRLALVRPGLFRHLACALNLNLDAIASSSLQLGAGPRLQSQDAR